MFFLEFDAFAGTGGVKHGADGALGNEARIKLFERAGGWLAGVGKVFSAGRRRALQLTASNSFIAM